MAGKRGGNTSPVERRSRPERSTASDCHESDILWGAIAASRVLAQIVCGPDETGHPQELCEIALTYLAARQAVHESIDPLDFGVRLPELLEDPVGGGLHKGQRSDRLRVGQRELDQRPGAP